MADFKIIPTVIIPTKMFLAGVLFGFNAGRKKDNPNPKPYFNGHDAKNSDMYLGNWFEVTCNNCGRLYTFDNANEIPEENLICETENCGNHIIFYGVGNINEWRVGPIKFL